MNDIEERARYLANQPYPVEVFRDKTTKGEDVYLAKNPDLPGCMAQGATHKDALDNLAEARFEYIESLLEDGEPVPEVTSSIAFTSVADDSEIVTDVRERYVYVGDETEVNFFDDLDKASQPTTREHISRIEVVTP